MDNLERKVTGCVINHPDGKVGVLLESINQLQKQLNEFGRVVEDYKQNLDLIEHLQQMMEEVLINPEIHSVALIWGQQGERKVYSYIVSQALCHSSFWIHKSLHCLSEETLEFL